jgi:hypothetical protein
MFCYFFTGCAGIEFLFISFFLLLGVYVNSVFMIVFLLLLPLFFSTIKLARPYFLAKIIENELKELNIKR